MKQSSLDALAMTGIELEELQDVGAALMREAPKDSRVCICGHGLNNHTVINGYVFSHNFMLQSIDSFFSLAVNTLIDSLNTFLHSTRTS